jgi:hypothetical protein
MSRLTNFGQQFAAKVLEKTYQNAIVDSIVNRNYEGEIKKPGDRVNILSFLNSGTLSDYVVGTDMVGEALVDSNDQLVVEKRRYWNFSLDRLEDQFTYADDIVDHISNDYAKQLEKEIDTYILQKIAGDTKEYTVPENVDTGPEKVPPRPDTTGGKNAGRAKVWDNKFAENYNPDGTKKKVTPIESKDTGNKQVTPEVKAPNSPIPSEPTSAKVSTVTTESQDLQIPKPVVDAVNSVNNTVVNSQSTSQVATLPIPSVRNQEPTYQELVLYSTRVV